MVTDSGQCSISIIHVPRQAYVYKTGTRGVTIFSNRRRDALKLMAFPSLDQLETYSAKQTRNADFAEQKVL